MVRAALVSWALLVFTFQGVDSMGRPFRNPPLSACEVLQNLERYKGKVIEIRGEFGGGTALIATQECPALRTGDFTWAHGIALEFPEPLAERVDNLAEPEGFRPYWSFDREAWERTNSTISQLLTANGRNAKVYLSVVGRLDVRMEFLGKNEGFDRPIPYGFGHVGAYPARLVMITSKDASLAPQVQR